MEPKWLAEGTPLYPLPVGGEGQGEGESSRSLILSFSQGEKGTLGFERKRWTQGKYKYQT